MEVASALAEVTGLDQAPVAEAALVEEEACLEEACLEVAHLKEPIVLKETKKARS